MIELRWKITAGTPRLEYRTILWRIDAAGAMSVYPLEWGPWVEVPIQQSDFAMEKAP